MLGGRGLSRLVVLVELRGGAESVGEHEVARLVALLLAERADVVAGQTSGECPVICGASAPRRVDVPARTRQPAELPAGTITDRVVWVPLQSVRDAELVQPTVARALGRGNEDTLLVLDNFEQVLAAASKVADLLAQFPKLKLLVTSREALHIGAEHEYPVAPLREREAVALFMERAIAAKPDFVEDEAVVEICRRIVCLPLALELAAARVKALSTEQLLSRLDRRLPMLTGGPRDAPERQQTLRALRTPNSMSYAAVGGPNQVVSASGAPAGLGLPPGLISVGPNQDGGGRGTRRAERLPRARVIGVIGKRDAVPTPRELFVGLGLWTRGSGGPPGFPSRAPACAREVATQSRRSPSTGGRP